MQSCATDNCTVLVNENKPLHILCRVATIAVTTAAVRTLMLPVVVYQMKNTARMSVSMPLESLILSRSHHVSTHDNLGASIC